MTIETVKRDARIKPAENGLILTYTEYIQADSCYEGLQYVGEKSEVFTMSDEDAITCINKLIQIYRHESLSVKAIAMVKSMNNNKKDDC